MNFIDTERVERLSKDEKDISPALKTIKLQEEVGELSQAMLKYLNYPNASQSALGTKESVLEELMDVLNVTLDLINSLDVSDKDKKRYVRQKAR